MTRLTRSMYLVAGALLIGGLVVATHSAEAEPVVPQQGPIVGEPAYIGSGCPTGTAAVAVSPDGDELSILFSQYTARTRRGTQMDRKTCNFAVPVRIPPGRQLAIYQVDYRGYADIPRGGEGRFDASYFFAGEWGTQLTRYLPGGWKDNFLFRDVVRRRVWSRCGESTIARSNTAIVVEKDDPDEGPEAYMAVDSADVEIKFYLEWRSC